MPPAGDIFFLPQKPYMPSGNLRQQLLYPSGRVCSSCTCQDIKSRLLTVVKSVGCHSQFFGLFLRKTIDKSGLLDVVDACRCWKTGAGAAGLESGGLGISDRSQVTDSELQSLLDRVTLSGQSSLSHPPMGCHFACFLPSSDDSLHISISETGKTLPFLSQVWLKGLEASMQKPTGPICSGAFQSHCRL